MKRFYTLLMLSFTMTLFGMSPQQYRDCIESGELRVVDQPIDESRLGDLFVIIVGTDFSVDSHDHTCPGPEVSHRVSPGEGGGAGAFPECATTDRDNDYRPHDTSHIGHQSSMAPDVRSEVANPDMISGWIYRDSMTFPFVSSPDMSSDPEIARYKTHLERSDAASLAHELQSLQGNLKDCSFIDRTNRFKLSRRLSFIAKHVKQGMAMRYLLLIHNTQRLEYAVHGVKSFKKLLDSRASITINGQNIVLDDQKRAELMQVARRLIEHRSDYQVERRQYPIASIGGELLDQGPVLNEIDLAFATVSSYQSAPSVTTGKQDVEDPFIDMLRRKIDINPRVNPQIVDGLGNLQLNDPLFKQYLDATIDTLKELEAQGLLTPRSDARLEAIKHGTKHYFKSLVPTNPLEHPKEFSVNLIKYTAFAAIHTSTGGVLLPLQIAADVAAKLHAIQSADTASMTPNDYAEFVAEELADITYQIAANKVMQVAKDRGIPQGFVKMTREMLQGDPEVALAGGGSTSAAVPEEPSMQAFAKKKGRGGSTGSGAGEAPARSGSAPKITTKEATQMAEKLGFKKTSYITSRGQRVFQNGKKFISIDVDNHSGGVWKMADSVKKLESKSSRLGTYDAFLKRIGD